MNTPPTTYWQNLSILLYAFIALLLASICIFGFKSFTSLVEKEGWVKHTHQVISTSKELLLGLNEAETSQRGYILTADSLYLQSYQENLMLTQLYLDSLSLLTQDNPTQQEEIKNLKSLAEAKVASMNRSLNWKNNNNSSALQTHFQEGLGRKGMDDIKKSLKKIVGEEEKLLAIRSQELADSRKLSIWAIYGFTLVALFIIILLYFLFRHHMRIKNLYELSIYTKNIELAATNEELQASMEQVSAGNEQLTELNDKLNHSQRAISRLNGKLEEKVKERTLALTETNKKLRIEIAEKRLAEDALQKARDLYDNAPEMYLSVNLKDKRLIKCNQTLLNKLGYSKDEIIGQPSLMLNDPTTYELAEKALNTLIASGAVKNVPLRIKTKKGEILDVLLNSTAILNEAGEAVATRSCWLDITELKKAQDKLQEREEHFRIITENASDLISKHTLDGTYTYASPASLPLLGYTPGELLGQSAFQFFHPEDISPVVALLSPANDLSEKFTFSYRKKEKEGGYIWYETTAKTLRNETGEAMELLCVSRDISERKMAEENLRNNARKLELANKELESFSYSVSHDLRAPLRAIIGYSKILFTEFDESLGEEGKEIAGYIVKNTSKMGILIDDLLAFSRLGRQEKKEASFNMNLLVEDVVNELKPIDPGRKIKFNVDPLPHSKGDPALIRHVVSNLLSNAIKFTSHRELAEITVGSFFKEGEVVYKFQDNGVGFNMKYVGKIFDVFQRLHSEAEFPGTGIGLALAQKIVHKHGGSIWAEGELDKGASFYFTLPKTEI